MIVRFILVYITKHDGLYSWRTFISDKCPWWKHIFQINPTFCRVLHYPLIAKFLQAPSQSHEENVLTEIDIIKNIYHFSDLR